MDFVEVQKYVLDLLGKKLNPRLAYHNVEHTIDVLESAQRLAKMENLNGHELEILKTAALFHDMGMLQKYIDHEEESVVFAEKILPDFGYKEQDIDTICTMIMTTKLPQSARSLGGMILCDADLDYLGRTDFHMISLRLKYEWDVLGINPTTLREWYQIQVKFLGSHKYFTDAARELRQQKKEDHLYQIMEICSLENKD
jgi:predicted metal-dependent HD superfamily phosphohydrolase